jgi:hypothetical protein
VKQEDLDTNVVLWARALEGVVPSLRTRSKGKSREAERATSEDAVSLGDPLSEEEMDDRRRAEEFLGTADMPHPPSHFLRLCHLPGDLSSFAFVERFA